MHRQKITLLGLPLVFAILIVISLCAKNYQFAMFLIAFLAFALSLFRDDIRFMLFPPDIAIGRSEHGGVLVTGIRRTTEFQNGELRQSNQPCKVWFFHLIVSNNPQRAPALNSRVICREIKKIDEKGSAIGSPYSPRVPLLWAHHDVLGHVRNIFNSDLCDLFSVAKGDNLNLELMFANDAVFRSIGKREGAQLILEFEHSKGVVPKQWKVTIRWNGEWSEDYSTMMENAKFEVEESKTPPQ